MCGQEITDSRSEFYQTPVRSRTDIARLVVPVRSKHGISLPVSKIRRRFYNINRRNGSANQKSIKKRRRVVCRKIGKIQGKSEKRSQKCKCSESEKIILCSKAKIVHFLITPSESKQILCEKLQEEKSTSAVRECERENFRSEEKIQCSSKTEQLRSKKARFPFGETADRAEKGCQRRKLKNLQAETSERKFPENVYRDNAHRGVLRLW